MRLKRPQLNKAFVVGRQGSLGSCGVEDENEDEDEDEGKRDPLPPGPGKTGKDPRKH
jgi:hypothetical protein